MPANRADANDRARPAGPARGWWADRSRLAKRLSVVAAVVVVLLLVLPLLVRPVLGVLADAVDTDATAAGIGDTTALEERSVVFDRHGDEMAVLHDEIDRRVLRLDDIPDRVIDAVLAAEDRRFYQHDGYDTRAIVRAAAANLRAGDVTQGASTITQQVAQQAFLDREQTLARKSREILHAVSLEEQFTKDEILRRYLNQVYFGSGSYGVAAAGEQYFRAGVDELSVAEAALLAGMIRSPETLDPRTHPERAKRRRDQVLDGMAEAGFIDAATAASAQAAPIEVEPRLEREPDDPYALEAVKREFATLEEFGDDAEARFEELFAGGLEIHTTLDSELQILADEVVTEAFPPGNAGPTGALASIDPRSEAIRALHGGADFDETKFDLATQGRRQPGSALKPLVAAAALDRGLSPDARFEGDGPLPFQREGTSEPWEVDNFEGAHHGTVDLQEATTRSVNTAYSQLMLAVGVEETIETADDLGVDAADAFGEEDTWGPSIVLGGMTRGITPLELATIYGAFADQGRTGSPYLIERVENPAGEVVYERTPDERAQALDPGANAEVVDLLRGVVDEGTGTAADLPGWDVLGKTGTTDDNTDAWFAGATATLSTAVWVGHPDDQVSMPGMTGGSLPAQLWRNFSAQALDGRAPIPLPTDPSLDRPAPESTTVPDLTGLPVGEALVAAADAGMVATLPGGPPGAQTVVGAQQPSPGTAAEMGEAIELYAGAGASGGRQAPGSGTVAPAPPADPDPAPEPEPTPEEPSPEPDDDSGSESEDGAADGSADDDADDTSDGGQDDGGTDDGGSNDGGSNDGGSNDGGTDDGDGDGGGGDDSDGTDDG